MRKLTHTQFSNPVLGGFFCALNLNLNLIWGFLFWAVI